MFQRNWKKNVETILEPSTDVPRNSTSNKSNFPWKNFYCTLQHQEVQERVGMRVTITRDRNCLRFEH